jgi:hypothetical protein
MISAGDVAVTRLRRSMAFLGNKRHLQNQKIDCRGITNSSLHLLHVLLHFPQGFLE